MPTLRSYDDPCGIARALDCVGERWALLIVRELLFGPKRYTDLRAGLPLASPNVLSQRLQQLEACDVLQKRALPPPSGVTVYELTAWGRELESVLQSLARWGSRAAMTSPAGAKHRRAAAGIADDLRFWSGPSHEVMSCSSAWHGRLPTDGRPAWTHDRARTRWALWTRRSPPSASLPSTRRLWPADLEPGPAHWRVIAGGRRKGGGSVSANVFSTSASRDNILTRRCPRSSPLAGRD